MLIDPEVDKVWTRVRDEAATSAAMFFVAIAEAWAARMEKLTAKGVPITPAVIWKTADPGLSGHQAS